MEVSGSLVGPVRYFDISRYFVISKFDISKFYSVITQNILWWMAAYLLRISFHVNQLGFLFDFQGLLKARSILN